MVKSVQKRMSKAMEIVFRRVIYCKKKSIGKILLSTLDPIRSFVYHNLGHIIAYDPSKLLQNWFRQLCIDDLILSFMCCTLDTHQ